MSSAMILEGMSFFFVWEKVQVERESVCMFVCVRRVCVIVRDRESVLRVSVFVSPQRKSVRPAD